MFGENINIVVEAQRQAERFVKDLRASGALDQIQRIQEALRHSEIDKRLLAQFQQAAAVLTPALQRQLEGATEAQSRMQSGCFSAEDLPKPIPSTTPITKIVTKPYTSY